MGDKKTSSPTRGRGGNNAARGGSPPRPQPRSNRTAYNSWASQRRRASTNDAPSSPERGQRQRGNRRAILQELHSPDLFDSPGDPGENLSNGSSNTNRGLNQIRQLLDNMDNYISDESVISVHDDTPLSDQPSQNAAGSTNNRSPQTYSSIHGARPRMRRRLPFDGRAGNRGANHSRGNAQQSGSTGSVNATQQTSNQDNTSTGLSSNSESSLASRRFQNIPPLRFRSQNVIQAPLSDSSDDQAATESTASEGLDIEPIRANSNPFLQGLGTEDDPYQVSPETPDNPSDLLQSLASDDDVGPRVVNSGGNSSSSSNNGSHRRGGGRGGPNRTSFGLARLRAGGLAEDGVFRAPRRVPTSPSPVLPPPGTLSDEELARRLQEEEWDAASVGGGDDGLDEAMLGNIYSPLHLFGAGYHRRRPQFGLHLPPLSGADDGNDDSDASGAANRFESSNQYFFDNPPSRRFFERRRQQRNSSPFHQISALADLTDQAGPRQAVLRLLSALVSQQEMESLMSLDNLDDANGGDYEALLALAERIGDVNRGLSEAEINKLPTRKHKVDSKDDSSTSSGAGAIGGVSPLSEQLQCHICLSDYESGDLKRLLPCGHDFHKECVDTWLKTNATCPVCRSEVKHKRS